MFSFKKEDPSEWPEYYIKLGIELVNLDIIRDCSPVGLGNQKDRNIKLFLYDLEYFEYLVSL